MPGAAEGPRIHTNLFGPPGTTNWGTHAWPRVRVRAPDRGWDRVWVRAAFQG